jgi:hypothetical protein
MGPREPPRTPDDVEIVQENYSLDERLARVDEEKRRALHEPGPSWREWWQYSGSKWWIGLGLFIADIWVVLSWLQVGSVIGALVSLVAVFYLEFLLSQYLWFRPSPERPSRRGDFRRTWLHPFEFGRWTPEAELVRRGGTLSPDAGPNPKEFL